MCWAKILVFDLRLFRVSSLRRCMQFRHCDKEELIISTTDWLSQWTKSLMFLRCFRHVKTPTQSAYNSRYSMLGLNFLMYPGFHCALVHLLPKIHPKPRTSFLLASVKKLKSCTLAVSSQSVKGLFKTSVILVDKKVSQTLQSFLNYASKLTWW